MKKFLNVINTYSNLPQSVYVLFIARLIATSGYFVLPFLTLFLTVKLNLNTNITGMCLTITSLSYIPGALIGGKLSDRYSKKMVLVISQLLSAACFLLVILVNITLLKIFFIILSFGLMGVTYPPTDALIADLTTDEQRKSSYSLLYLGFNIGYAIGPLIAGFLFYEHAYLLFAVDALSTIISAMLILCYLKQNNMKIEGENDKKIDSKEYTSKNTFSVLLKQPKLILFLFVTMIYVFSYAQYNFSLPLYLNDLFSIKGLYYYGILMTVNASTVIALTSFINEITRNQKAIFNIFISGIFYTIGFGMYFFSNNLIVFILCTIIWTIGEILLSTNFMSYVVEKCPSTHRGRMSSIANVISRIGFFISPLIMGNVINDYGTSVVWVIIFAIMFIATIIMLYIYALENKVKTEDLCRGETDDQI